MCFVVRRILNEESKAKRTTLFDRIDEVKSEKELADGGNHSCLQRWEVTFN